MTTLSLQPLSATFEYVSQDGTTQQWKAASQALGVGWRGTVLRSISFSS
jgi:hypothetical protein